MSQARSEKHVVMGRMPDIDPWVIDCAYDESMCRTICENHPHWVWMGTGENWPMGADSSSLFVTWHPSSISAAALKKGVDLNNPANGRSMSAMGLFRLGTLIGAIDAGKMAPEELEAMASLILPRTPPVGLSMGIKADAWLAMGDDQKNKAFEVEAKKLGVHFALDFAAARLPLSSQAFLCQGKASMQGDFEQELADRVELFRCRGEAKLIASEAPESTVKKRGARRSV